MAEKNTKKTRMKLAGSVSQRKGVRRPERVSWPEIDRWEGNQVSKKEAECTWGEWGERKSLWRIKTLRTVEQKGCGYKHERPISRDQTEERKADRRIRQCRRIVKRERLVTVAIPEKKKKKILRPGRNAILKGRTNSRNSSAEKERKICELMGYQD